MVEETPRKEVLIKRKMGVNYNINEAKEAVTNYLTQKHLSFEHHIFDSGCSMIDLKIKSHFYVIQIEHDSTGFSLEEGDTFCSIPDERFYELSSFFERLKAVLA